MIGAFASVILWAGFARSEEAPAPLVSYLGAPECPTATEFSDRVEARTRRYRSGNIAVEVELSLSGETPGSGARGRVAVKQAGRLTERELRGRDCDEVVEALALIVAITIDPEADTRPHPREETPPSPAPEAPSPLTREPPPPPWGLRAGVALVIDGAIAPDPSFGQRAFVSFVRPSPEAPLSSVGAAVTLVRSGTVDVAPGESAAFEHFTVRLEGCSFGLQKGALRLEPCLFGEGGLLSAQGTHPAQSLTRTVGWAALGPLANASVTILPVLSLRADLGAVFALTRYRFAFIDEPAVVETPAVALTASLGLAVALP